MIVGEIMTIVKFSIEHARISTRTIVTSHQVKWSRDIGTIVVRGKRPRLITAHHHHSAQAKVILFCGMPSKTRAGKDIIAHAVVVSGITLIFIGVEIVLLALGASACRTMAVAYVKISIYQTTVIIDIETTVRSSTGITASLQRAIITSLPVFLENNIDDAHATLSGKLCRRIVYHLYTLDAFCGQLLQYLRSVIAGESTGLAINPHLHASVSPQGYISIIVHFHGRNIFQSVRS
ncbi:unknown [Prevotella sp. CAG:1320]|nr:unknown [Prevotella sp. CAG:1320]